MRLGARPAVDVGNNLPQTSQSWIYDSGLRKLNAWMFLCLFSSFSAGYDGSLFSGLLTLKHWFMDFAPPNGNVIGVLGMSGVLGLIAGPWLGQSLSDRFGRKWAMMLASATLAIGAGVSAIYVPNNPESQRAVWIVGRVIGSVGAGVGLVAAPALMTELAHPRHRVILVSFFWCGFFLGSVVAAWLAVGTNDWFSSWSWRLICLVQAGPAIIQMPFLFFLPHSPRWLIAKDRPDEACELLVKYHANGDADHPIVFQQMTEIQTAEAVASEHRSASILELFNGRGNLHRVWIIVSLAVATQWVGNGIITYYLPSILATLGITDTKTQSTFNGGLQTFNLVVATFWGSQAERFGRRKLFLCSAVGMLVSYIIVTALSATYAKRPDPNVGRGSIAFLFIFYFFYCMALTPLAIAYPAEILPYRLRSKGLALSVSMVAIALVFNIWVNPIAEEAITWKLYIVYVCVIFAHLLNVFFFFPETKGRTIEAIEAIFDGDKAPIVAAQHDLEQPAQPVPYRKSMEASEQDKQDKSSM